MLPFDDEIIVDSFMEKRVHVGPRAARLYLVACASHYFRDVGVLVTLKVIRLD
jgi:hypothetical protein